VGDERVVQDLVVVNPQVVGGVEPDLVDVDEG
jgi:hypothetical protein